jgi:polyferredoxin
MRKTLQTIVKTALLAVFIFLTARGRIQIWMLLFAVGVLLSFVLGRIYCGWICPINTTLGFANWLKTKFKIKDRSIPDWLKQPAVRIGILVLFVAVAAISQRANRPLPVLPALVLFGFLLTLVFPEQLWHRYLCPYGSILHFPGKRARHKLVIDQEACINCGLCAKVCPTGTISKEQGQHLIHSSECLLCLSCQEACRKDAIHYR